MSSSLPRPAAISVSYCPSSHLPTSLPPLLPPPPFPPPTSPPSFSSLPLDVQWQVLSFTSLPDLPHLTLLSSTIHSLLTELKSNPPPPSSPHSPSLPHFTSPFPSLFSDYQHAKPLLTFLSQPHPFSSLLPPHPRHSVLSSFTSPPAHLRPLLLRFPPLHVLLRRKAARLREQSRLIDLTLSLLSLLPLTLPLTTLLPPLSPFPLTPPLSSPFPHLPTLTHHYWLLLYAVTLTWTDVQWELIQRLNAHLHRARAAARGDAARQAGAAAADDGGVEAEWAEDEEEGGDGVEGEGEGEGEEGEEEHIEAEDDFRDEDLRFQRRLLRRGEALLLARARAHPPPPPTPPSPPPHPPLTDAEYLSLTSTLKATLAREQGAPLPLLLLTDLLSAVRSELWSRHLLPPLLFLLFLCWTFSLRYFLLLDALRLIIEGMIPLIPLLAITRSILYPHPPHPPHPPPHPPPPPPSPFSLLVDSLNRPSVIVGLRSLGLGITLAINGGHWKEVLKRLCDRLLLPLMDVGMGRMVRVRRGGEWVSPFEPPHGWLGSAGEEGLGLRGGGEGGWEVAGGGEQGVGLHPPQLTGSVATLLLDHAQHWVRMVGEMWGRVSVGAVVSLSSVSFRVLCRLLLLPSFTLRSLLLLLLSPTRLSHAALLSLRSIARACSSYFAPTLRLFSLSLLQLLALARRMWAGRASFTLPFPSLLTPGSPYLPSPSSSHRLFALALFISQAYSRDDSRAWLLTPSSLLQSIGKGMHHWCLSIILLRVSWTAGLPTSIALHALFNWTSTLTRYLTLTT